MKEKNKRADERTENSRLTESTKDSPYHTKNKQNFETKEF
jgi:hypothetical protein